MNILKLTYNFAKKYMAQYLFAMTKPVLVGLLGLILFSIVFINPAYALIALLSIPCLCFAFWRGYVITYFLCDCADSYLKGDIKPFEKFVEKNKNISKNFVGFVGFVAIISMLLYLPSLNFISNHDFFTKAVFINTILLSPFLNYSLQAYYYKKHNENYFKLFLNCYSKLNPQGIAIAFFITIFTTKLAETNPVLYVLLALIFNVFIYAINTFWYASRRN